MAVIPKQIDRSFATLIARKRIVTGTASIVTGFVFLGILVYHATLPPPLAGLALVIFLGGGGWTLRDGLRLRRELRRS